MKEKIALLLAGILVGGVLLAVVPAGAHHATALKKLKNRVTKLENKVSTLKNQTQLLDSTGFYNGVVISEQVIALCPPESTPVWEDSGVLFEEQPIVWIDDCFVGPTSARRDVSDKQLQRAFGR